ncbi:flagellar attachment zone protein 1 isoform X2 [Nematostella vectensis]|uniref:flagellar attachment zone protein 1 isoform X2 n=1 Tax=Nematostella vectensis TaxID=45351 RepID=UPI002077317B|nr:flagellar attachment zone protein 1 isoform X2 [Nematostella vectensis]
MKAFEARCPHRKPSSSISVAHFSEGRMPDLDIMSSQLQRTITDLNDLTLRYQEVLKERRDLENKLDQAESDLEVKHKRVEELERQKSETTTEFLQAYNFANTAKESVVQQLQRLHRDLQERNSYIIALQMKLLSSQERIDSLKGQLAETQAKADGLEQQLSEVTRNYDHQRRESIKLCERLETHKTEIQRSAELKQKLRETQFNWQKAKADCEKLAQELNELKDWCEVLNSRYDIVETEKNQIQESHESKAAENSNLRRRIDELELRISLAGRETEELKKAKTDMEETLKKLKEQRDSFAEYRKEALSERDAARIERDEAVRKYNELLTSRDETITKHAEHSRHFEMQSEKATEEIRELHRRLAECELENQELYRRLDEEDEKEDTEPDGSMLLVPGNPVDCSTCPDNGPINKASFNWKERRQTTNIIESMKKRLNRNPGMKRQEPVAYPTSDTDIGYENLDKRLEELVPEMAQLSVQTKQCLSLERNKYLFKSPPQFEQLAHMFESSICSPPSSLVDGGDLSKSLSSGDFSISNALSSTTSTDSGIGSYQQQSSMESDGSYRQQSSMESDAFEAEATDAPIAVKSPKKPPFLKSYSTPSSIFHEVHGLYLDPAKGRSNAIKVKGKRYNNKALILGDDYGDDHDVEEEVKRALESPSIAKHPFRDRAQAFHFTDRRTSLPLMETTEPTAESGENKKDRSSTIQ